MHTDVYLHELGQYDAIINQGQRGCATGSKRGHEAKKSHRRQPKAAAPSQTQDSSPNSGGRLLVSSSHGTCLPHLAQPRCPTWSNLLLLPNQKHGGILAVSANGLQTNTLTQRPLIEAQLHLHSGAQRAMVLRFVTQLPGHAFQSGGDSIAEREVIVPISALQSLTRCTRMYIYMSSANTMQS